MDGLGVFCWGLQMPPAPKQKQNMWQKNLPHEAVAHKVMLVVLEYPVFTLIIKAKTKLWMWTRTVY